MCLCVFEPYSGGVIHFNPREKQLGLQGIVLRKTILSCFQLRDFSVRLKRSLMTYVSRLTRYTFQTGAFVVELFLKAVSSRILECLTAVS